MTAKKTSVSARAAKRPSQRARTLSAKKPAAAKPKQASIPASSKTAAKPAPEASAAPVLLIAGDGTIALEYAVLAASKRYNVHLWNVDPLPARSALPEGASIVNAPTASASVAMELTVADRAVKQRNLKALDAALPATAPIISSSLTVTTVEQASWIVGKHRLAGCAALPTYASKPAVEVAPTVFTPRQTLEAVGAFYASIGQKMELVQDRVGLVSARIICQLINEAAFALQEDVARPEDVDTAMQLGVNYPHGPFAWAEILGLRNVVAVLQALHTDYAEERYRVSPLLRQMALGGEWWRRQLEQSSKGM
jgi:3-hydroxybutyryl-CoA dehydrogenase